jgi:hypothetical protein
MQAHQKVMQRSSCGGGGDGSGRDSNQAVSRHTVLSDAGMSARVSERACAPVSE